MIRIREVKLDIEDNNYKRKISKLLNIKVTDIKNIKIVKRSIDARKKDNILYVYEFDVELTNEKEVLKRNKKDNIFESPNEEYVFPFNEIDKSIRPVIVGSGPAGLYCAYILTEIGIKPIIIERGEKVEDRVKSIEDFWNNNKLNINSNVQFGEGGAGTFSDGKLNTNIKDKENRIKKVLEVFVENGANEDILYESKPHIGTDILREVIKNMRNKIVSRGGEIKYNTTLTNLIIDDNKLVSIEVNNNEIIECNKLVLAIGHSARDTFKMLLDNNLNIEAKPFAVGLRIEHPQSMINESQYGNKYKDILPPASYKLTYNTTKGRGVYSFCMCPGGYVVNASSEEKRLVVNGMSNNKRESKNANSAIVVTVSPKDFGTNPMDGIEFQRKLEENAYNIGLGNIPIQRYIDYKNDTDTIYLGEINPQIKGQYSYGNLNRILPDYINESIKEGIEYFGTKIKGFNREDAILLGVESRTSSPIRIIRDESFESNIKGIYPCGEGAGYAGGITSAAVDGIKVAEKIVESTIM